LTSATINPPNFMNLLMLLAAPDARPPAAERR
jgi:hypothetical protein